MECQFIKFDGNEVIFLIGVETINFKPELHKIIVSMRWMYGYNYMPILYFKAYFNYEQFLARFNTWQPPNGHLIISISLYLYLFSL